MTGNVLKRAGWVVGLLMLGAAGCSGTSGVSRVGTTTIILARHAERDPGDDPPLNAAGRARAEALRQTLSNTGVTAIYCTDLERNRSTVRPLAEKLGLKPKVVPESQMANPQTTAAALIREWTVAQAGGVVLWMGNTGSSKYPRAAGINQEIFRQLGGTGPEPVKYSDLFFVVARESGRPTILRTSYGGVSAQDSP